MKKVLSFSIFDAKGDWQFLFYIRGLWFNVAMASIVYPGFEVWIYAERSVYIKYSEFFRVLSDQYGCVVVVKDNENLCRNMLWRMLPVFESDVDYCFCRDADALVTSRESDLVARFISLNKPSVMCIHDNQAHAGLMGGLTGFKCSDLRDKYNNYQSMLSEYVRPIDNHGSDQAFLNAVIYADFKDRLYNWQFGVANQKEPSDLCIAFIGAAGCNEMETLRYLRAAGIDLSLGGVGKMYPSIFYWL